jgi:alkanesulfonate monooxygenase SsuD/methylene tetrahydromethanopterin reductase-like flavin-dependent oxidoreductase (luciferase family)
MDQAIAFDRAWGRRLRRLSPRDWRRWRDLIAGLPLKALAARWGLSLAGVSRYLHRPAALMVTVGGQPVFQAQDDALAEGEVGLVKMGENIPHGGSHAGARRPLPPGTPTICGRPCATCNTRSSAASRPSGRPNPGWSATPSSPWPPTPPSTERIKVASGVINNWTRNPALIAATFLTLDDLAPNRIILGIGAWWDPLASKVGIKREKPLKAMREVVTVVRDLLAMKRVTFHGEFVHLTDVELDVVYGRREPRNVPIYIGATGMQMMELAGEIADGVLLNYLVSPKYNELALHHLEIGAQRAGRRIEDIDRPQLVVCSVDHDRKKALDSARKLVTQYLGQQPHIMKASGVPAGAPGRDRARPHLAGHPGADRAGHGAGPRRYRPADHRQRVA